MLKNTIYSYGSLAKFFHWLMALLFIGMYIVGFVMINLTDDSTWRLPLFDLHKATGLLLFTLVALRLFWRFLNPQPELATTLPRWQHYAASANILLLYVLMFAMPITGFLTSTLGGHPITFYHLFTIAPLGHDNALSDFFAIAHEYLAYLLIASFSLHVLGALYHHYFLRDNVLKRMWVLK